MHPEALIKSKSRLRLAKKALETLSQCENFDDFTDAWFSFVTAFKSVYTTLEQGAKASPQSRQWFGAKQAIRRKDPLLQYVYQARNDDEHGLAPVARHVPESLAVGVSRPGYSSNMRISMKDGTITAQSLDGLPVLVEHTAAHAALVTVTGLGNVKFHPPTTHLGQAIERNLPLPVARLAFSYLEKLVEEAGTFA
jgi:hypothetical protein